MLAIGCGRRAICPKAGLGSDSSSPEGIPPGYTVPPKIDWTSRLGRDYRAREAAASPGRSKCRRDEPRPPRPRDADSSSRPFHSGSSREPANQRLPSAVFGIGPGDDEPRSDRVSPTLTARSEGSEFLRPRHRGRLSSGTGSPFCARVAQAPLRGFSCALRQLRSSASAAPPCGLRFPSKSCSQRSAKRFLRTLRKCRASALGSMARSPRVPRATAGQIQTTENTHVPEQSHPHRFSGQ